MKVLQTSRSFKKEFRRQLRFAITAAIGFTVAFAWRNAIYDTLHNFVSRILDISPTQYTSEVYSAIAITVLGVILIFVTARILKESS
jgi:hypothetical protein